MKVLLPKNSNKSFCKFFYKKILLALLLIQFIAGTIIKAEGTVDFIGYPGYRLMLFAERVQQTKVFAKPGEFINFGASHVGITGGFIRVYRPDGTLYSTYDNTGASAGLAIINNNTEEVNGPTGGGTSMGDGYRPGIVEVQDGEEGAWSITFEYPTYTNAPFDNLLNADPWDRATNQPTNQRVVLAWDITVSQNGAGNNGGDLLTGRVYSNEYQSIVNFNGNLTSPTFYILTPDGFQYQVDYHNVDPWGFPIFSSNWGIVSGDEQPTYSSWEDADITRSADMSTWNEGQLYLYEPQAEDTDNIINNKVFFNPPDPNMPSVVTTTDIYRNNTHDTWLYNPPVLAAVVLQDLVLFAADTIVHNPPVFNALDPLQGAWFTFTSTLSGTARLDLDLNFDGDFNDEEDVALFTKVNANQPDSLLWNGMNGLGEQTYVPEQDAELTFRVSIFGGEVHILMSDVENDLGGVTFTRINGDNAPVDTFYYDHRGIGGVASGGAVTGEPLATTTPYTYTENFGNRKTLDYWTYVSFASENSILTIDVIDDLTEVAPDSDGDSIRDDKDIDDDNDGIPDRLEYCIGATAFSCLPGGVDPSGDIDFDGVLNFQDTNDAAFVNPCTDADGDGRCDNLPAVFDWDNDGVPNHLDLDSDNDGITDLVEANHDQIDTDGNGMIDGIFDDFKTNGLYNLIATNSDDFNATINYTLSDADTDGVPDFLDLDSDNDGILDIAEAGHNLLTDANGDGMGEGTFPLNLTTRGLLNELNPNITNNPIPLPLNSDNDQIENFRDKDSDNDGINDVIEGGNLDADNDGVVGVGIPMVDDFGVVLTDGTGNTVPYATANTPDSDADGVADYADLDSDNDGINDVIEGGNLDADNDGFVGEGVPAIDENGQPVDANGVVVSTSNPDDSDADGVADYVDLDSDNDGINDVIEGGNLDMDNNGHVAEGIPTINEYGQPIGDNGEVISTSIPNDTDGDSIPNHLDLDSDNDGIHDVVEGGNLDSDNDGVVGTGTPAVNEDGQPLGGNGEVVSTSTPNDTDGDNIPNYEDLDSDNDGINDVVEGGSLDSDNDGVVGTGTPAVNEDGQPLGGNGEVVSTSTPNDTDGDNIPNYVDLDSDNDGINDVVEGGSLDSDNDGVVGTGTPVVNEDGQPLGGNGEVVSTSTPNDTDGDNIPNYEDLDSDNDGINDVVEGGNLDPDNDGVVGTGTPVVNEDGQPLGGNGEVVSTSTPNDTDGDNIPNYVDLDSDNDGINDVVEGGNLDPDNDGVVGTGTPAVNEDGQPIGDNGAVVSTSTPNDTDGDNIPNYEDLDSDNDGINDVVEGGNLDPDNDGVVGTGTPAVNEDGQPLGGNGEVVSTSTPNDTDGDNIPNYVDLDSDNDGINDVVEGGNLDPDNDGVVGTGTPVVNEDGQPIGGNGEVVSTSTPNDTDGDNIPNYEDLDSDNDGINDVVEGGNLDPDNDGVVGTGTPVVNEDGQPIGGNGDVVSTSIPNDTDGDNIPNYEDLDSDNDGINDVVEGGNLDPDNDGVVGTGTPVVNEDGQPIGENGDVVSTSIPNDTDGDNIPNYVDLDSDNDGINDVVEGGNLDPDNDGVVGTGTPVVNEDGQPIGGNGEVVSTSTPNDTDGDNIPNYVDLDSDNDGINDVIEGGNLDPDNDGVVGTGTPVVNEDGQPIGENGDVVSTSIPNDTDGDNIPNYVDLDSDNDGINDVIEGGNLDPDNDGVVGTGTPVVNEDGQPIGENGDVVSTSIPTDTDGNGDPDYTDLDSDDDGLEDAGECSAGSPCPDFDGDGTPDFQDIDSDNDGIEDGYECPTGFPCPDTDGDGETNQNDTDSDDDGILDEDECPEGNPCPDTDGDNDDDYVDVDSDDDGLLDEEECPGGVPCPDFDDDGTPDQLDADCSIEMDDALIAANDSACEGEEMTFTIENSAAYFAAYPTSTIEFVWEDVNGTGFNTSTNPELVLIANAANPTQTVTVRVKIDGCLSNVSIPASVTISAPPTATIMATTTAVCAGESIQLNAETVTDASYAWYIAGTTNQVSDEQNPTFENLTENTTYQLVVSTPNCPQESTDVLAIRVNPEPTIQLVAASQTFCTGEQVVLSAMTNLTSTENVTYTWSGPAGDFTSTVAGTDELDWAIGAANAGNIGMYSLTIETESGCTASPAAFQVEVADELATPALELSSTALCEGSSLSLSITNTAYTDVLYQWMYQGMTLATTSIPSYELSNLTAVNTGDYIVQVISTNCGMVQSLAVPVEVINNPIPAVENDTQQQAACEGQDVVLRVNNPISEVLYKWYGPSNTLLPSQGDLPEYTLTNVTAAQEGEYYVETEHDPASAFDCEPLTSEKMTVEVNKGIDTPIIAASNTEICENGSVTFEVINNTDLIDAVTYEWHFIDANDNDMLVETTSSNTLDIDDLTTANQGTYYVVIAAEGCASNDFVGTAITVSELPTEMAAAGIDETICGDGTYQLQAMNPTQGSGQWTSTSTATILDMNDNNSMVAGLQEGDNVFVWSLSNGACENYAQDMVTITVSLPNEIADAGTDEIVCNDGEYMLQATNPTVGTGQWEVMSGTGAILTDTNNPNAIVTNLQEGDNVFVWSLSVDGCPDYATQSVTITYNPTIDEASILSNYDDGLCLDAINGVIILEAALPQLATGTWEQTIGPSVATIDNINANSTEVADLEEGLYVFNWSLTVDGCPDFASNESIAIEISATPMESAMVLQDVMTFCVQDEVMIEAVPSQIGEGQWIALTDGVTIFDADNPTTQVSGLSLGENQIQWVLSHGNCENYSADILTIMVEEGVEPNDDTYSTPYGMGVTGVNVLDNDDYNVDGNWSVKVEDAPQHGEVSINAAGDVTYIPNEGFSGTDVFSYELCNESCEECETAFVTIDIDAQVNTDCFVPNIITPNGDNFNDALVIPCVAQNPNNHIMIFNRWGDKVYDVESYNNDWDGEYKGTMLPAGTYFYIFKQDRNADDALQGYISICR